VRTTGPQNRSSPCCKRTCSIPSGARHARICASPSPRGSNAPTTAAAVSVDSGDSRQLNMRLYTVSQKRPETPDQPSQSKEGVPGRRLIALLAEHTCDTLTRDRYSASCLVYQSLRYEEFMSGEAISTDRREVVSHGSLLQVPYESDGFQQSLRIGFALLSFRTDVQCR
jgi:hypothetical protein